ncbi:uncharacterized protein Z520_04958 [Fonsecaea multimorphosa CBS 102226]|uniref:Apple domain-containing protein n=1 Tax=Fonsecaea multimorphosa CBS 102226 TaxID=1442371 RepID=A0A0D2K0R9_9EURO|nr:uncharacterized protein Z520_04958 [Fonsecaea multimorphosa CBS 102226]KIX99382.1 hypothetical protein Z520_04958 [Fonsecaea multimorphosa CBS 102226]OAL25710.1 hypothetical protein AYO22_04699 [Fonsecaea multimorphosa]
MKTPIVSLLAVWPLLAAAGVSLSSSLLGPETVTIEHCSTIRQGNNVPRVTTTTYARTITIPVHVTSSITPTVTVTPPAVTITSTTSTTTTSTVSSTAATPTSTFTATLTLTSSTTTTSTITASTSTSTEVDTTTTTSTTTLTSTVPTSSGFLPVISTLPGSAEKRKREVKERQTQSRRSSYTPPWQKPSTQCKAPAPYQPSTGGQAVWDTCAQYPSAVECQELVEIFSPIVTTVTATAVSSTLTTATTTTIITSTSTATTTATVTPPTFNYTTTTTTMTTTTITAFSTTTPSTTITSTSTITASATTSTVSYAACATPNLVGTLNGDGVYDAIYPGEDTTLTTTDDGTAYDCCASCISNAACAASAFNGNFAPGEQCFNFVATGGAGACTTEGEYSFGAEYDSSFPPDSEYFISNGNCGFYTYSESD